jgi:hypothetical protein
MFNNDFLFDQISCFNFSNNGIHSFYSNNQSQVEQKLQEIESYLSFVVTHCDSENIEEILIQKLKVEKAIFKLCSIDENTHNLEKVKNIFFYILNQPFNFKINFYFL